LLIRRRRRQQGDQPPPSDPTAPSVAELGIEKSLPHKETVGERDSSWQDGQKAELGDGVTKPAMAELSSPAPLSPEEYAELDRRRRAAELQSQSVGQVRRAELQGQPHPRAELEALRADAKVVHELGGHSVMSDIQP